jgi:hypothetical protein
MLLIVLFFMLPTDSPLLVKGRWAFAIKEWRGVHHSGHPNRSMFLNNLSHCLSDNQANYILILPSRRSHTDWQTTNKGHILYIYYGKWFCGFLGELWWMVGDASSSHHGLGDPTWGL